MPSFINQLQLVKPIDPNQPFATDKLSYDVEYLRFGTEAVAERVRRLLDGARRQSHPHFSETPNMTGDALEEAYRVEAKKVLQRTFALSVGRALYAHGTYEAEHFKLPIEPINYGVHFEKTDIMKTVKEEGFVKGETVWPYFHTGAAAGLRVSPQSRITADWINRFLPNKLEPQDAGALLAFGLNGFLDQLFDADRQRLFAQKEDYVTVALLLGVAVTEAGSRRKEAIKMMGAFITSLLPKDTAEFVFDRLTVQAAATLGLGIIFMNSVDETYCHHMLLEIERMGKAHPQHLKKDYEACCLAAGFALGFITLGKGYAFMKSRRGFKERLYALLSRTFWTAEDNALVNMNATSPAITYALGLMFMKTEDKAIADSIPMPDSPTMLDFIQADLLIHRVVARNLIMWKDIQATDEWIESNLPEFIQALGDYNSQVTEEEAIIQARYYIICGACLCIGLKFAGTRNEAAFQCLLKYLDFFMTLSYAATNQQKEVTKKVIRDCINVACTATAMVMAGTGNVLLLERLKKLHHRINGVSYGDNMAASMALGLLYMGLGSFTIKTSNEAIASLLLAFYPLYPTSTKDNQLHLQAFRHLWIFARDRRWITPFDTVRQCMCKVPLIVETVEGNTTRKRRVEAPAVLETLENIRSIQVIGDRYDPLYLDLTEKDGQVQRTFLNTGTLYVQLSQGKKSYEEDPQGRKEVRFFTRKEIARLRDSA